MTTPSLTEPPHNRFSGGSGTAATQIPLGPEQIAARLRVDFPDDPEMWVSHETTCRAGARCGAI